jgi:Na+-transporting NADH:ubiquinone oxidoreductase subunit NqrB
MNLAMKSISLSSKDLFAAILPGASASLFMFSIIKMTALFVLPEYSFVNMVWLILIGVFSFGLYFLFDSSPLTKEFRNGIRRDLKKFFPSIAPSENR